MLAAGGPVVQQIIQNQGKLQAMLYANQTLRKIISCQQMQTMQLHKSRHGQQIELE